MSSKTTNAGLIGLLLKRCTDNDRDFLHGLRWYCFGGKKFQPQGSRTIDFYPETTLAAGKTDRRAFGTGSGKKMIGIVPRERGATGSVKGAKENEFIECGGWTTSHIGGVIVWKPETLFNIAWIGNS